MTEYWVSNPRQWCNDCKCFFDSKAINVKKHETSKRHRDAAARRRNMLNKIRTDKEAHAVDFQRQMAKVEAAARKAHLKDIDFSKHSPPPEAERSAEALANFSKFPPMPPPSVPVIPALQPFGPGGVNFAARKDFAPPPGMSAVVESVWVYKDRCHKVQGPFRLSQMQQWFARRFFPEGVQVRNIGAKGAAWRPLRAFAEIVGEQLKITPAAAEESGEDEKTPKEPKKRKKRTDPGKRRKSPDHAGDSSPVRSADDRGDECEDEPLAAVEESTGMGCWTAAPSVAAETPTRKLENDSDTFPPRSSQRGLEYATSPPAKSSRIRSAGSFDKISDAISSSDEELHQSDRENLNDRAESAREKEAIAESLGVGGLYDEQRKGKPRLKMRIRKRRKPKGRRV